MCRMHAGFGVAVVWAAGLANPAAAAELFTLHPGNYADLVPAGKEVDAIHGDYVLRNDRIVATVADPTLTRGRSASRKSGFHPLGFLIDLTSRDGGNDLLTAYLPLFTNTGNRDSARGAGDPGEPHKQKDFPDEADAFRKPGREPQQGRRVMLAIPFEPPGKEVRYILEDGQDHILVEAEVAGGGKQGPQVRPSSVLTLGPVSVTGPDVLRGDEAEASITWIYDPWFGQAYAMQAVDHEAASAPVAARGAWLMQTAVGDKATVPIPQGGTVVFRKRLFPGRDAFTVVAAALAAADRQTTAVEVAITSPQGAEAGTLVRAYRGKALFAAGRTDARGRIATRLPPGTYRIVARPAGRPEREATLDVADTAATAKLDFPAAATVSLDVRDAAGSGLPCKVEFRGRGDTPDPFFFPDTGSVEVRNLRYLASGTGTQILPPGSYDVIVSRGPEYDHVVRPLDVAPESTQPFAATLTRKLDTRGWMSADLGNRSTKSPGTSVADPLGRVLNLAAEHVEFGPATEDDFIFDYQPIIAAAGLERFVRSCAGIHLTERVRKGVTSQNCFPVIEKPAYQDGGAVQRPQHVYQVFWLNGWYGPLTASGNAGYLPGSEKLIQVTPPGIHENDGTWHGMWSMFGAIDRQHAARRMESPDRNNRLNEIRLYQAMELQPLDVFLDRPEYDPADPTDASGQEAWQAEMDEWSRTKQWPKLATPNLWWLRMLNQGWRIPGVANTNSTSTFHGNSQWRSYVKVGKDDPAALDPLDMVRAIKAGRVVMSSGPFMEVSIRPAGAEPAAAVGPGEDLAAPGGRATLAVRIQAAPGVVMDTVQVLFNGRRVAALDRTRARHPEAFSNDVVQFAAELPLEMAADTRVIVVAGGKGPNLRGVLAPAKPPAKRGAPPPPREFADAIRHVAMSNPVYVDVNGDGFRPAPPWQYRVAARMDVLVPAKTDSGSPPAKCRITFRNLGTEPAADSFEAVLRPSDAAAFVGPKRFDYELAPGEQKTFDVEVGLAPGFAGKSVRVAVPASAASVGRTGCAAVLTIDATKVGDPASRAEWNWWLPEDDRERPPSWLWPEFGRPAAAQ